MGLIKNHTKPHFHNKSADNRSTFLFISIMSEIEEIGGIRRK
nr:MAG TPA: hypothetical protein [Caudoviricetes sp.]